MMKKIAFLLVAAVCFAGAQDNYDSSNSSYEESENKTDLSVVEKVNSTTQPETEPGFYIGIHPITLIVYTALNAPMVYVTIEKPTTVKGAFMIKPGIFYMGEGFVEKFFSDEDGFTAFYFAFEIGAGYRHYFNFSHRGSYVEADFVYSHGCMKAEDNYNSGTISTNVIGGYALIGWKSNGPVIHSFDIGIAFMRTGATATGDIDSDKANSASGNGVALTGNYSISLGF